MGKMGRYCKAYTLARMREFDGWAENAQGFRASETPGGGGEDAPADDGANRIVYLQENYVVTDGIFVDEHVIFDQVTPEWTDFCRNALGFDPAAAGVDAPAEVRA